MTLTLDGPYVLAGIGVLLLIAGLFIAWVVVLLESEDPEDEDDIAPPPARVVPHPRSRR